MNTDFQITERQKQALDFLKTAIDRCKQDGLPKSLVVHMVKVFLGMWGDK